MSLVSSGEPESALSVIREASEENYGSSALFHFRLSKSKVVPPVEVEKVPPESMLQTNNTKGDGEIKHFRTVVLISKQPYSSCCCVTF